MRTHRSNIINVSYTDRIKRLPSGSGRVFLKNGIDVSVSKKYMRQTTIILNK